MLLTLVKKGILINPPFYLMSFFNEIHFSVSTYSYNINKSLSMLSRPTFFSYLIII